MNRNIMNERIDCHKAIELFQKLPEPERIRVEGVMVGMILAREQPNLAERREGA